ncbi:MAG: hypothetical protein PHY73_07940 [Candidatus Omnitrophica bacterium]|nr:hypothetical protein [Candidatus Omnitrophota bacterium]
MKEIAFKNLTSVERKRKIISLREITQRDGCVISSQKTLVYIVSPQSGKIRSVERPEYHIGKLYDSVTKEERFSLRVKGTSYVIQGPTLLKVDFCHSLKIDIKPL